MKVTIDKKAKTLTIVLPLNEQPKPSSTGKSVIHAGTSGNIKTDVEVDGKALVVSVNAYTPVG